MLKFSNNYNRKSIAFDKDDSKDDRTTVATVKVQAWWLVTCAWKLKVPGSSAAARHVQRWTLYDNRSAIV